MNLLLCCGKKSVRLSEPTSAETCVSVSHNAVQNNDGKKKRGSSTWKKCKKWTAKHLLRIKKSKVESAQSKTSSASFASCPPVQKDLQNVCAEGSAADIILAADIICSKHDSCTNTRPAIRVETEDKNGSFSKTNSSDYCTGNSSCSKSSTSSTYIESSNCSKTPVQNDQQKVSAADIDYEHGTNTCEDDPGEESPADKVRKEENGNSSYSYYTDNSYSSNSSTSSHSTSSSNNGSSNELSITNLNYIAGHEEELCEENMETLVNANNNTSVFLIREEGEGEISLDEEIGKGGFGSVRKGKWSARKNDGDMMTKDVAIKIVKSKKLEINEVKALSRCKHPSIIELHFVVVHAGRALLGLELACGGDLMTYIEEEGPLLESHARILFGQIVDAVEHCHMNGIVHMDLKPENILMYDRTTIKLTDFGLSLVQPDPAKITAERFKTNMFCGTLPYMAPEIFTHKVYDSRKCDVWSLGCVLFVMLTYDYPYSLTNIEATNRAGSNYLSHARRLYKKPKFPPGLSIAVRGLIITMLRFKVKYRTNISKIQYHYWFANHVEPRF